MEFTLIKHHHLESTNAEAHRLYQSGKAENGMVIIAEEQSNGKGHGDNAWESEPGKNLTFSILFKPAFIEPAHQFAITQIISLSLWEVLDSILRKKKVTIKWPNDIYVGDKKIAGVLIQNFIKANSIDLSVIGVGLNVSQKHFFSDAPNPTSIILESGMECPHDNLLEDILETFAQYIERFNVPSSFTALTKSYLEKLYRIDGNAIYKDKNGLFSATISGISEYGHLLLTDNQGVQRSYGFKEVEFVNNSGKIN